MTDEITMHSVLFGIMIALVGIKTRMIIAERVKDVEVRREVRKLCSWGGGMFVLFSARPPSCAWRCSTLGEI